MKNIRENVLQPQIQEPDDPFQDPIIPASAPSPNPFPFPVPDPFRNLRPNQSPFQGRRSLHHNFRQS